MDKANIVSMIYSVCECMHRDNSYEQVLAWNTQNGTKLIQNESGKDRNQ